MSTSFSFQKNGSDVQDLVLTAADFVSGAWHSDAVSTSNDTRVVANIVYKDLNPDGSDVAVDYRLQAVLEGKDSNGTWMPLVKQFTPHFRSESADTRRLIVSDQPTGYDPAVNTIIPDALGNESIEISTANDDIPAEVRICVVLGDVNSSPPKAALTSFKLTATGSKG